jgi:hypothetical protein
VVPAGGYWRGSIVSFWVAANGSRLSGGGYGAVTMVVQIPAGPNTTEYHLVYDDIPVQFGRFEYTSGSIEIIGRFTSTREASGTYKAGGQSGTWQASLP